MSWFVSCVTPGDTETTYFEFPSDLIAGAQYPDVGNCPGRGYCLGAFGAGSGRNIRTQNPGEHWLKEYLCLLTEIWEALGF